MKFLKYLNKLNGVSKSGVAKNQQLHTMNTLKIIPTPI